MKPKTWFVVRYHYAKVTLDPDDPAVIIRVEVLSRPTEVHTEAVDFYDKLADKVNASIVETIYG